MLDRATGTTITNFSLGPIETLAEARKLKRKWGLRYDAEDLRFCAWTFSQDIKKGWLACGAFSDKRVRVVSTKNAGKVVFEANTDINPRAPWGGAWRVLRVDFLAGAGYLLVEYDVSRLDDSPRFAHTEIYETSTWSLVWQESNPEVWAVTLSPDANWLACLKGIERGSLELHPFVPKTQAQKGSSVILPRQR